MVVLERYLQHAFHHMFIRRRRRTRGRTAGKTWQVWSNVFVECRSNRFFRQTRGTARASTAAGLRSVDDNPLRRRPDGGRWRRRHISGGVHLPATFGRSPRRPPSTRPFVALTVHSRPSMIAVFVYTTTLTCPITRSTRIAARHLCKNENRNISTKKKKEKYRQS